jgi:hypothetical protein
VSPAARPDQRRDLLPERKILERELTLRPKQPGPEDAVGDAGADSRLATLVEHELMP